jgi:spermidine synthase
MNARKHTQYPSWKTWLSYLWEQHLESVSSEHNPHLYVSLSKGRLQLSAAHAIYSFEDLYDNFRLAFEAMDWKLFPGKKVLVLGLGLGSVPQILEQHCHRAFSYTTVEIDEAVIYLAQKYALHRLRSPMQVVCADASAFVLQCEETFDLITMDVFQDDEVPAVFLEKPFLQNLKKLLSPQGLLMYNMLARTKEDKKRTNSFYQNRFLKVFPEGQSLPVRGNSMLLSHPAYLK